MIEYNFSIEVRYTHDLNDMIDILKLHDVTYELVKYANKPGTIVRFDSSYGEHELIKEIESRFHFYESKSKLGTGKFDVRIHINRYKQPFSLDDWGRPLNSEGIEENIYLVMEETDMVVDVKMKQINRNSFAGVFKTLDRKSREPGYAVYIFPTRNTFKADLGKGQLLFTELFKSEEEAFSETEKIINQIAEKKRNENKNKKTDGD